ncbi:MAG TPA: ABC transporter ATP-binding protein [Candidatus Paceibacterota bacterium]|jgi:branched-chain amino acid transport system ATP-binding protein|nr:ABC transporter ATP-binding protein [Candidatus Paceibacterota bacterium]
MKKEILLDLENISSGYGEQKIIHDVSLCINEGEIVALMGPNGAGKSTILKAIFGLIPHTGNVLYEGKKIQPTPSNLVRMGVAYVPQGRRVFNNLTVEENLEIGGFVLNDKKECMRRATHLMQLFPALHAKRKVYAGTLSGGQQQLLSIARGLMMNPKLLLLDEPTLGLAPKVVKEIFQTIKEINQSQKTAILVVEHNLQTLLPITDRAYVLNHGKIVAFGTGPDIGKSDILERVFMGKI